VVVTTDANAAKAEALRSVRRGLLDMRASLAEQVGRKGPVGQTNLREAIRHLDLAVSEISCRLEAGG
jgi:hypothetical protein